MSNRIVLSSDHVDRHNEVMTKEALESGARIINGPRCVKWTVEHKRDVPPLGKIVDGKVIFEEGHYYLTAKTEKFDMYEEVEWSQNLLKASCKSNNKPFNETQTPTPEKIKIEVDPQVFKSYEKYEEYKSSLHKQIKDIDSGAYGRKALINDPEIIITLSEYYILFRLLKPILEKTTEKVVDRISDKVADEFEELYNLIRFSISEMLSRLRPTKRPLSYVIKIPGVPEIELFARIRESKDLTKALKRNKIEKVKKEIDDLSEHFTIEKAQFVLENNKWKFNYLLSDQGEAIGTKKSFKRRDKILELTESKKKNRKK